MLRVEENKGAYHFICRGDAATAILALSRKRGQFESVEISDGSKGADAALQDLQYAGLPREGVEAVVLSVADVLLLPTGGLATTTSPGAQASSQIAGVVAQAQRASERAMRAVAEMQIVADTGGNRLSALFPAWDVSGESIGDSPAWGVLKKENGWQPVLTVVGAHSGSLLETLFFDNTAQRTVTQGRGSVRVGRAPHHHADDPLRLLVGIDGSPDAQCALDSLCARSFARSTLARLVTVSDPRMAHDSAKQPHSEDRSTWVSSLVETAVG